MALTETESIARIEVLPETHVIQVQRARRVIRDGAEVVSSSYHRSAYTLTEDLTHEDPLVQAIAQTVRTGVAGTPPPAPPSRVIPTRTFLRFFTVDEEAVFDAAAEADPRARVLMRRLLAGESVNLDHPEVPVGLQMLREFVLSQPLESPARVWANAEVADLRIARILSGQPPA